MSVATLKDTSTLVITECFCGMRHAVPKNLYNRARADSRVGVYCPAGHQWFFTVSSLDREKERSARLAAELDQVRAARDHAEASRRAQKAATTRLRKRVEAGVCPHCTRTFQNLQRHMQTKHAKDCAA